jgi:NADPH-dependent glutamate synthase beta subunit-like oxidoreductase
MRPFELINAATLEEAASLKGQRETDVLAGGTDILSVYKNAILKEHPKRVVSLTSIPEASGIEVGKGAIIVKAMTKLADIAESPELREKAAALAEAAHSVATPLIRNIATIGGNICQDVRCWFYRYPHETGGRIDCARKGADCCYAIQGDNRYHSIFGGMRTHADPCVKGCPAGTDIPGYMDKIRAGDWDGAARIIMRVNPMPMCTSRICPHPCQDNCNQSRYGDCVGIYCVERSLGDYILKNAEKFYRKPAIETGKKIAVVGAGPGGLTCAYFMRRQGHDVTVIDAHEKAGGVLYYGIPHYRLPRNIVEDFTAAIAGMGVKFRMNTIVGKDILMDNLVAEYDNIYFGTGAWKQPILGIQGEELTRFGLDFLVDVNTFLQKAIDNDVLVCGGGNVAMDVALTAKRMGAKNVSLVCLEQESEMPATAEEIARAREEGVKIFNGWGMKRVITDKNGKAAGLESMRCTSVFDEKNRFNPTYDNDDTRTFDAAVIILATGQRVDTSFMGEFGKRLNTERGLIEVDEKTFQTKNEKIFAGGDVVTGPNIAIRAINAGGQAAKVMNRKLGTPIVEETEDAGFITFDSAGIKDKKGAKLKELPLGKRTLTDEDTASLSVKEAEEEARRCMNCGCYSVSASDISPVLVAFGGKIITTKKEISAKDFFTAKLKSYDMLDPDELVTAVRIPDMSGYVTGYIKDCIRPSIDFALISLAYAYRLEHGKIADISLVFGGVAPVPVKLEEVEKFLIGKVPSADVAAEVGKLAVKNAAAMRRNSYKIVDANVMVKRLIESISRSGLGKA